MSVIFVAKLNGPYGTGGDVVSTVAEMYLPVAVMTLVGIGFPVLSFFATRFLRPTAKGSDTNKTRSILLPGYEVDHSLYVRRDTTYECGSEPLGEADINFHFQYYWYAIVFLVFDIAFMFLAFGGVMAMKKGTDGIDDSSITSALLTMSLFILLMGLGVWHVFRKRGRIYI
jgi:NADH:ubiquinone oxidoreductase subunit 3 (subunit A)|tara:strand:- start:1068 stop:1580 length:513 start_codon:yes stop_codon:yes gene_type:complete